MWSHYLSNATSKMTRKKYNFCCCSFSLLGIHQKKNRRNKIGNDTTQFAKVHRKKNAFPIFIVFYIGFTIEPETIIEICSMEQQMKLQAANELNSPLNVYAISDVKKTILRNKKATDLNYSLNHSERENEIKFADLN